MNTLRFSTLSSTLAIAVITLGLPVNGWAAPDECKGKPSDRPDHCEDDNNDTETNYLVALQQGGLPNGEDGMLISNGACGITEGEIGLGVRFPKNCVTVQTQYVANSGPCPTGPVTLHLFWLGVREKRSDVNIFLSTEEPAFPQPQGGEIYVSERLPATISENEGSLEVEVDLSDLAFEKNHQPCKGELAGPIAVGEIIYTPIE